MKKICRWIAILSGTFVATIFWGFLAAMLIKTLFGLSENQTRLYVGLPVAIGNRNIYLASNAENYGMG